MLIHVTQEDIDNGVRGEPDKCPVARAMYRACGERWFVYPESDCEVGYLGRGPELKEVTIPLSVDNFATKFDNGRSVEPFSFRFTPPETNNVPN